ncbi:MAG: hypothetical protein ACIAXF_01460, partial [Phycisphaerales bacterium JB063]
MTLNLRQHTLPTLLAVLCVCLLVGCGEKRKPNPIPPDSVFLYAIDGPAMDGLEADAPDPRDGLTPDLLFYSYPILGQVDLTGTDTGKQLTDMMELQRNDPNGDMAECFKPRHALRVVRGDVTTDYVICFQCSAYDIHSNGAERGHRHHLPDTHADARASPRGRPHRLDA